MNNTVSAFDVAQWVLNVLGSVMALMVGFLFNWLWKLDAKVDKVRLEVLEATAAGDDELKAEMHELRAELSGSIKEHREDFKEWQNRQGTRWEELSRWRETMLRITPTQGQLDRKLDEVIDRLDSRINPLLNAKRRRSRGPGEGEHEE